MQHSRVSWWSEGALENVLEKLESSYDELALFRSLSKRTEDARRRPDSDLLSILTRLCHLYIHHFHVKLNFFQFKLDTFKTELDTLLSRLDGF